MQDFKEAIEKIIKHRKLSMREVSIKAGLDETAIRKILTSESSPRLDTASKISKALGLSLCEVLSGERNILNKEILDHITKTSLQFYLERKDDLHLDCDWVSGIIALGYEKYAKKTLESDLPINDNVIYAWLEGRMDRK